MASTILAAPEQPGYKLPDATRLEITGKSSYSRRCELIEQQRQAFINLYGHDGVTGPCVESQD